MLPHLYQLDSFIHKKFVQRCVSDIVIVINISKRELMLFPCINIHIFIFKLLIKYNSYAPIAFAFLTSHQIILALAFCFPFFWAFQAFHFLEIHETKNQQVHSIDLVFVLGIVLSYIDDYHIYNIVIDIKTIRVILIFYFYSCLYFAS